MPRAIEILNAVAPLRRGDFLFPSFRADKPLSNMAFDALLTRMKVRATDFPRELAEAALAHAVGDSTERAYRRGDALDKRRVLMETWAAFIERAADPE